MDFNLSGSRRGVQLGFSGVPAELFHVGGKVAAENGQGKGSLFLEAMWKAEFLLKGVD